MDVEEYRRLNKVKEPPQTMKGTEWRAMMKKKGNKPKSDHANDIRMMLTLAKIDFVQEHKFHPTRKWKFDFAIVEKKVAIEMEGIFSDKSRHTSVIGYSKDCEKYNEAVKLGWKVLRYTAVNFVNCIDDLNQLL